MVARVILVALLLLAVISCALSKVVSMNLKINKNLTDILKDNVKYKAAKERLLDHLKGPGGNNLAKSVNRIIVDDKEQSSKRVNDRDKRGVVLHDDSEESGDDNNKTKYIHLDSIALEAINAFVTELDSGAFDSFVASEAFDAAVVQARFVLRETRKLSRKHADIYPQSAEICTLLLEYLGQFLTVDTTQKKYMIKVGVVQLLNEHTVESVLSFVHRWYRNEMRRFAKRNSGSTGSSTDVDTANQSVLDLLISAVPAQVHDVIGRILSTSVKGGDGSKDKKLQSPVTLDEFTAVMTQVFESAADASGLSVPNGADGVDIFAGLDVVVIETLCSVVEALRHTDAAGGGFEGGASGGGDSAADSGSLTPVERLRQSILSIPQVQDFISSPHNHSSLARSYVSADMLGVIMQQLNADQAQERSIEELLAELAAVLDSRERFDAMFDTFNSEKSVNLVQMYKDMKARLQKSASTAATASTSGGNVSGRKTRRRRRPGVITPDDTQPNEQYQQQQNPQHGEPLFQAL